MFKISKTNHAFQINKFMNNQIHTQKHTTHSKGFFNEQYTQTVVLMNKFETTTITKQKHQTSKHV